MERIAQTAARGGARGPQPLPRAAGSAPAAAEVVQALRRFHVGAPDAGAPPLPADAGPALLHPFRDRARVRTDFPLHLRDGDAGVAVTPVRELLQQAAAQVGPQPDQARMLKDNLLRLERDLATACAEAAVPPALQDLIGPLLEQLPGRLGLQADAAAHLAADAAALRQALPAGRLLGLDQDTPVRLWHAAAVERQRAAQDAFGAQAERWCRRLQALLEVDRGKDPGAGAGGGEGRAGALGSRFLDAGALARVAGEHRGTLRLPPERRAALEQTLTELQSFLAADGPAPILVNAATAPAGIAELPFQVERAPDPCAAAATRFDAAAAAAAALVRAGRRAELELRGSYDPARHESWLRQLDWHGFREDELLLLPPILVLVTAEQLSGSGLPSLSLLLRSGRPVHVLVTQSPLTGGDDDRFTSFRLELAYLGVAHREAFVQQSSAARPAHLLQGFQRALAGTRAALHVLDAAGAAPGTAAFLRAGAAIEGRAHPLFHYDPEAGETWARRFSLAGNPDPEQDWPAGELVCQDDAGAQQTLAVQFTFADFALTEPAGSDQFRLCPGASDDLVPLAEWLGLDDDAAPRRLPFVWIADADGALHRAVVARALAQACRDRLRFWHTLQELAGIRNEYVREATERARQEAAAEVERVRAELQAAHAAELERVRAEAAGAAMAGLARMLLGLDPAALTASLQSPPTAGRALPAAAPAAAEPAAPAADDDDGYDEPWIESARCTTCNDCININSLLFVYDANKQARIGDARAGTFAQLVLAAEKCPARCIHPGKPLDPDEPGLAELVQRAAPFNR